jgi:hypothetical protein
MAGIVVVALAAGAPAALAQPAALNATYSATIGAQVGPNGQLIGPNVHAVACPDDAFACGSGTDANFGPFSWAAAPTDVGQTATLTFATGTLVIDDTFQGLTAPGQSLFRSVYSAGNPLNVMFTWNVDPASSGRFQGATGSGSDTCDVAGFRLDGVIAGLINLP